MDQESPAPAKAVDHLNMANAYSQLAGADTGAPEAIRAAVDIRQWQMSADHLVRGLAALGQRLDTASEDALQMLHTIAAGVDRDAVASTEDAARAREMWEQIAAAARTVIIRDAWAAGVGDAIDGTGGDAVSWVRGMRDHDWPDPGGDVLDALHEGRTERIEHLDEQIGYTDWTDDADAETRRRVARRRRPQWADEDSPSPKRPTIAEDDDGEWVVALDRSPLLGSGPTRDDAIDDFVEGLREFALDWPRLAHRPNLAHLAETVAHTRACTDEELRRWVTGEE